MIARSQLAALMCLAAAVPAIAATNPSVPPLTIRIDPIVPRGGSQAPPDQHFPQLDAGDLSLQDALYGAWRRRTRRELAVTMPPEVIKDAAEEIAKTNEQATAAVAQYIIKPTVPVPKVQLKVKGLGCTRLPAEWAA